MGELSRLIGIVGFITIRAKGSKNDKIFGSKMIYISPISHMKIYFPLNIETDMGKSRIVFEYWDGVELFAKVCTF